MPTASRMRSWSTSTGVSGNCKSPSPLRVRTVRLNGQSDFGRRPGCRIHESAATSRAGIGHALAPALGRRPAEAAVPIS
jgi:hypothetical protein